jgi:hypothetical protein
MVIPGADPLAVILLFFALPTMADAYSPTVASIEV